MHWIQLFIPYLILTVWGTTFYAFMTKSSLDLFQVGVMAVCSILFFIRLRVKAEDIYMYAVIVSMLLSMFFSSVFDIPSFGYSVMFILTFLLYKDYVHRGAVKLEKLDLFLKDLLYAYAVVQIIQFISHAVGIKPLNGAYTGKFFWRPNSLSNEPSHTAVICLTLMVSYIYLEEIIKERKYKFSNVYKKDMLLWISYVFVMVTSTSATAFLALPLTFFYFMSKRNLIIFLTTVSVAMVLAVTYIKIPAFERVKKLTPAVLTLDAEKIRKTDNSASARINPYIYYLREVDLTSSQYWFGFGRGYSEPRLIRKVLGSVTSWKTGAGGIFPITFYDYGLITGLAIFIAIWHFCFNRKLMLLIIVWFLFYPAATFNTYFQWLFICLAYTCSYFRNRTCYEIHT